MTALARQVEDQPIPDMAQPSDIPQHCPPWCGVAGDHEFHRSQPAQADHVFVWLAQVTEPYVFVRHNAAEHAVTIDMREVEHSAHLLAHVGHYQLAALIRSTAALAGGLS